VLLKPILPSWLTELLPRHLGLHLLLTLLCTGLVSVLLPLLGPLQLLESRLFDLRSYFAGQARLPHPDLVLLELPQHQQEQMFKLLQAAEPGTFQAVGLDAPSLSQAPFLQRLKHLSQQKNWSLVVSANAEYNAAGVIQRIQRPAGDADFLNTGLAYYPLDIDGTLREQPLLFRYRQPAHKGVQTLPTFAYALYHQLHPGHRQIHYRQYFDYPRPQHPYTFYNLASLQKILSQPQVLAASAGTGWHQKVLIVTEPGLRQPGKTPFQAMATRLELHAYALSGLLDHRTYVRPELLNSLLPFVLSLAGLLTLWFTLRWGRFLSVLALLTLFFTYLTLNAFSFRYLGLWLNLLTPSLSLLAASAAVMLFFQRTEGQARQELYSTFRRHLPAQKVRALMEQSGEVLTQNERRIVTVMFTDIQGFSKMSEKLPSDQIIRILNEYLTAMTDIIFENQGSLDKYIGDGIMAVYGNIGTNNPKQDAYYAVKTALEMQARMAELQKKWMNEGLRPIQIRIGINTGEALVGHVGHPSRKEVTVIGDTVNTTSRIEKLNKPYHTHILISHSTYEYVKEHTEVQPLGEEQLKGKTSSVMVYEVRGWKVQPA